MATDYETICGFLDKREIEYQRHDDGAILVHFGTEKYKSPDGESAVIHGGR